MTNMFLGLAVFVCVFAAGFSAMWIRRRLPEHHMSTDSRDTVKITMGLVATLTALVLGLMISSAKDTYEDEKHETTDIIAKTAFLDRLLSAYGPETKDARAALRRAVEGMLIRYWPEASTQPARLAPEFAPAEAVYHSIRTLSPQNDEQRDLKTHAMAIAYEIGQKRWLVFEQSSPSVSPPMLVVVVCWLVVLFFSFGLYAPSNATVNTSMIVGAFAVASAVFLVLELDQPFTGLLKISCDPVVNTLKLLGR